MGDQRPQFASERCGPWSRRGADLRETSCFATPNRFLGLSGVEVFPCDWSSFDAADWLSVQVHPDEESVDRLWPGEGSKTEAWFVSAARPGSRIYAGLLYPGVDERQLRQACLEQGTVADCLYSYGTTGKPGWTACSCQRGRFMRWAEAS